MFYIDNPYKINKLNGSIIIIEGNISSGKSTLGHNLQMYLSSKGYNCVFFEEYKNIKFLSQYISDMTKYSYTFQLFMLNKRIQTYQSAIELSKKGGVAIIDRSIIGDYTFCNMQRKKGNITQDEFDVYCDILKSENLIYPHFILYLDCDIDVCMKRIKQRGIQSEIDGYSREYISDLKDEYEKTLKYVKEDNNNIIINIDNNNFVDVEEVYNIILKY